MKTTDGWYTLATANNARTIFSPSPIHLDVNEDALILKNVEFDFEAIHLPEMVQNLEVRMRDKLVYHATIECTMGNLEYDKIPISVFPVPGGPNKRIPLGGERSPVNISGLSNGKTTISFTVFFTKSNPAISFQSVGFPLNKISKK